jgi:hypothetical protein
MLDFHLNIKPHTANRLKKIIDSYSDQEAFAQNVIGYQLSELKRGILNLQLDLQEYESQYQMSSPDFYEQFSQSKLDDSEAFITWAGLYEMLLDNEARLQELA